MKIKDHFKQKFAADPAVVVRSPGRVNLIGEHVDYSGGTVLPAVLPVGIDIAMSPRSDSKVHVWSETFEDISETDLDDIQRTSWADYAVGAVLYARRNGLLGGGADLAVSSTIPVGAGLSSSAALIVGILKAARDLSGKQPTNSELAVIARQVENDYIGVPCGIMDQMAVAIAQPGQALALNTGTLDYETVDLPVGYHFAVLHSGQYRALTDGHYKVRKEELDAAKTALGINDLCLLPRDRLGEIDGLPDPVSRRARHCVSEHHRTLKAVDAMKRQDVQSFAALMNESHVSMRDDFEMSLQPIDALVETTLDNGALGARLTGGGFGGCIVALVPNADIDGWTAKTLRAHPDAFAVC